MAWLSPRMIGTVGRIERRSVRRLLVSGAAYRSALALIRPPMPPADVRILNAELDTAEAMMVLVKLTQDAVLVREYRQIALSSYRSATRLMKNSRSPLQGEDGTRDRIDAIRLWLASEGLLNSQ